MPFRVLSHVVGRVKAIYRSSSGERERKRERETETERHRQTFITLHDNFANRYWVSLTNKKNLFAPKSSTLMFI